jgi:hypothetical protein
MFDHGGIVAAAVENLPNAYEGIGLGAWVFGLWKKQRGQARLPNPEPF